MITGNTLERRISRDKSTITAPFAATKDPERRRGSWSFLTWAFILGDLVAAELFIGRSAQADVQGADQGDEKAGLDGTHPNSAFDDIAGAGSAAVTGADNLPDDEASEQHNSHLLRSALHHDDILASASKSTAVRPAGHDATPPTSDGSGGGGDGGDGGDEGGWHLKHRHCCHEGGDPGSDGTSMDVGTDGNDTGTNNNGIYVEAGGTELQAAIDVKQLLGFDLHVGEDGAFVSLNKDIWPDLNLDHLVSELTQDAGLANVDLRGLLGFDVQLDSGGAFVLSDLVPGGLPSGVDLNNVLNGLLPQTPVAASLLGELGKAPELPGLIGDLTDNLAHAGDSLDAPGAGNGLLGEVNTTTGLSDSGSSLLSLAARIPATVLSQVGGEVLSGDVMGNASAPITNASLLSNPLESLTVQSSDDTSLAESPASTVLTVANLTEQLGASSYLSLGTTLNPMAAATPPANELFIGTSYTDYNMALQSQVSNIGTIAVVPTIEPADSGAVAPTVDSPPPSSEPVASPVKPVQDASTSLVQTQSATADLVAHVHL